MALWIIGPPPDDGLFLVLLEEGHGDHLDPESLRGDDLTVLVDGLLLDAHDLGDVGTVDVHVKEADAVALFGQGSRQVDGDGSLAHTALSAVDGYLVSDLPEALGYLAFLLPGFLDGLKAGIFLGIGHL